MDGSIDKASIILWVPVQMFSTLASSTHKNESIIIRIVTLSNFYLIS